MQAVTPVQPPSQELLAALEQLQKSNFRKQDGGSFNPDALTPSAKADPIGQILLSCGNGRLGVEGYRQLQRLYPDGVVGAGSLPNFSNLNRTTGTVGLNEKQILMIVCGGQTGVDQGALMAAELLGYERGGIVPKDRATAAGRLNERHPMTENHSNDVNDRTQHNFTGADGTLGLYQGSERDGTTLTIVGAYKVGRPVFMASIDEPVTESLAQTFAEWLQTNKIRCLNVGGPRQPLDAKENPEKDFQAKTVRFLRDLLGRTEAHLKTASPSLADASLPR